MNIYKTTAVLTAALFLCSIEGKCQSTQRGVVEQFGKTLTEWSKTGDEMLRFKADKLVKGSLGCYVEKGHALSKMLEAKYDPGILPSTDFPADNYLNLFTKGVNDDMTYECQSPEELPNYKEPNAYVDKTEAPLHFFKMKYQVKGPLDLTATDVFFVRNKQITRIEDFTSKNSIFVGLQLYAAKEYEAAFRHFRRLAYESPDNEMAQYYTAVMEIKGQGCGFLGKKVRDMEAAWWLTRGLFRKSWRGTEYNTKLASLFLRYSVDVAKLPYSQLSENIFIARLMEFRFVSNGLIVYRDPKTNKFGYMAEDGKLVIPCVYEMAYPFDNCGVAIAMKGGKLGYINTEGEELGDFVYTSVMPVFFEDKSFAQIDNTLFIVNRKGGIEKVIEGEFGTLYAWFIKGKAVVKKKGTDECVLIDTEGNVEKSPSGQYNDYVNMVVFLQDAAGKRVMEEPFGWY